MRCRVPSRAWSSCGLRLCAALSVAAVVLVGCTRPETAADRHFAEMREQVSRMQAEHDKLDQRLGALEVASADEKPPRGEPSATGVAPAPPPRVVQLGGPTELEPADPNDPSARPDIRVTGVPGAASIRPRSGKSSGRARVEESELPGVRPDAARPSALDPDARKAYEVALAQVQAKQYDRGLEGLNAFLVRWPDHPYAENAMYWRGEAHFAQGDYLRAAEQFEAVIARFGSGNKAPDALLKVGACHERLGALPRAREYWDRLKTEYPRSDAAKRIPPARDAAPGNRTGSGSSSGAREDRSPKGPKENR